MSTNQALVESGSAPAFYNAGNGLVAADVALEEFRPVRGLS